MNRLKTIREARGLEPEEVADALGLDFRDYLDLEYSRGEWSRDINVRVLKDLATLFGVSVAALISISPNFVGDASSLIQRFREYLISNSLTVEQLIGSINFDLTELVRDPARLDIASVEELFQICRVLGLDWLDVADSIKLGPERVTDIPSEDPQ